MAATLALRSGNDCSTNPARKGVRSRNFSSTSPWSDSCIACRKSPFADRFVLKGALLLTAWRAPLSRPTMDIDLAGRTSNELDHIAELVGAVCEVVDGTRRRLNSIPPLSRLSRIKEDADYEGVRVKFHATLAKARIPMQIDIGFGDVIVPAPTEVEYPTLLDFPRSRAPRLSQGDRHRREARSAHQTRPAQQPHERLLRPRPPVPDVPV